MEPQVHQKFSAALDALIERVKEDRSILAAILCGSLSHDTVWARSDIDLALEKMREIRSTDPDRFFFPGEFENPDNPEAQLASGEEIWEQAGGRIDAVVGAQGTGGWISGVARALKGHDPSIRAFAVEPSESEALRMPLARRPSPKRTMRS